MGAFYVVLIAAIFGSVVNSTIQYDSLHGIGALGNNARKSIENTISDAVEISRIYTDINEGIDPLKATNIGTKALHLSQYIFKTEKGKQFAKNAFEFAGKSLKFATKFIPFASETLDLVQSLQEIFDKQPDWKIEFEAKILEKGKRARQEEKISDIETQIDTFSSQINDMNRTIECFRREYESQHLNKNSQRIPKQFRVQYDEQCEASGVGEQASQMHGTLWYYANMIAKRNSPFKQYPLLGAPVLIELSMLASGIEPMIKEFIWNVATKHKLSCIYRDVIIDYLPYVLEERFEKVTANITYQVNVRNEQYNRNGYNDTPFMQCDACSKDEDRDHCLVDEFGTGAFRKSDNPNVPDHCQIGYLEYLRHLVESMFPIDVLDKACNRPWGKPTGNLSIPNKKKNFIQIFNRYFFSQVLVG